MSTPFETTPFAQDANASAQSRLELQAKLNGLGGLNGRKLSPEAKEKKLREACEGFESIFIQKMWQEMRNTVPKSGLLQSNEEHFWQDMYDQELSKSMTRAGGIGLADMMFEQLSRNLVSASRSAVGQSMGSAFTPDAAPLVNASVEEPIEEPQVAKQSPASIYDGEAPGLTDSHGEGQEEAANVAELMARTAMANIQAAAAMASQPAASRSSEGARNKVKVGAPDENSGLHLSYMAKRDAGDKLGSHAVRPSMYSRKQKKTEAPVEPVAQNTEKVVNQGSAEALKEALDKARSGNTILSGENSSQLHNIVAAAQARNAMNASNQTSNVQPEVVETASVEPKTTKVTFTTNIPQKGKNNKGPKKNDVIRMLNVDNVGVNSKQGQGLAAYHAAQEVGKVDGQSQTQAEQNKGENIAQAPISPLTAQSLQKDNMTNDGNFAIPPLKAGNV